MIYFGEIRTKKAVVGNTETLEGYFHYKTSEPFTDSDGALAVYHLYAHHGRYFNDNKKFCRVKTEEKTELQMKDGVKADSGWAIIDVSSSPVNGNTWVVTFGEMKL